MKIYVGIPGPQPVVTVTDDAGDTKVLPCPEGRAFGWGKGNINAGTLALAILENQLGDTFEAARIYRRFMHRTIAQWDGTLPFRLMDVEIAKVLEDIAGTEKLVEAEKIAASRMVRPVENEGGIGVGGGAISPITEKKF